MSNIIAGLAAFMTDFYKPSHRTMYPADTEVIYSNFTPRTA